jgi:hypothetical protein
MNRLRHSCACALLVAATGVALESAAQTASSAACEFQSGPTRARLLELYTSEGCDSCPPADRWLSKLPSQVAGGMVVPLAFHVDYWDALGWKDAYAQAAFSKRQSEAASRAASRVVYTPQFMLDGRDMRPWGDASLNAAIKRSESARAGADLRVNLKREAQGFRVSAEAQLTSRPPGAALYLALTQNNISTAVKAGENRGVTLKHDHVVRQWVGPLLPDAAGRVSKDMVLPLPAGAAHEDLAVVAFVQSGPGGEVLQALRAPGAACKAG